MILRFIPSFFSYRLANCRPVNAHPSIALLNMTLFFLGRSRVPRRLVLRIVSRQRHSRFSKFRFLRGGRSHSLVHSFPPIQVLLHTLTLEKTSQYGVDLF